MRKHLTIIAVCLLTLTACTKSGSSSTGPSVNSTESQLVGTWYQSKTDVTGLLDTSYTGYNNTCYIQFTSNAFPGTNVPANYKLSEDAIGMLPPSMTGPSVNLWYYDASTFMLVIGVQQFSILTLSASNLTIKNNAGVQTTTYYFHK